MKIKIGIISLGCPKNLVDSEIICGILKQNGYQVSDVIENADLGIVNTCSFIEEAKEESVDIILKACALKQEGRVGKILVAGCLPQRYKYALDKELGEVDAFIGPGEITQVAEVVKGLLADGPRRHLYRRRRYFSKNHLPRLFLTPRHFRYLKISDGCDNRCSYCIIPKIRGRYQTKPLGWILEEAEGMVESGAAEINLIGQDTTAYGRNLYSRTGFGALLKRLTRVLPQGIWVRILYTHPKHFNPELIKIIKDSPAICKYIDLPLQHINGRILKRMGRGVDKAEILRLIARIRKEIPAAAIRTSFIVGFPGETDREFEELFNFIKSVRFERLGVFAYSREESTPAYYFKEQIPQKVKQERLDAIMRLQQRIACEINATFKDRTLRVLIDERLADSPDTFLGRSEYDAPEVDGSVFVKSRRRLKPGDFVNVKITDTLEYDLSGYESA